MPEGDTIFRTARALDKALAGRVVVGFETTLPKLARVNEDAPLVGRVVERVEARGKWCLIHFSAMPGAASGESNQVRSKWGGQVILLTHMLMNGSWHIYRTGERWRKPRSAMRVAVRVQGLGNRDQEPGFEAVAFNVQVAEFHTERSLERETQVPPLGPDVLDSGFTVEAGVARLEAYAREHPETEVGVALLNQHVLAGLGNVYKSEVAFAAEVNPWRKVATLTRAEMERLVEFAQRYMQANVADTSGERIVTYTGYRRTTHRMDESERLWVYKRSGQECRRCGATILMRKQGEQARSTYWCPECQKAIVG